jgi:hypothetical protein
LKKIGVNAKYRRSQERPLSPLRRHRLKPGHRPCRSLPPPTRLALEEPSPRQSPPFPWRRGRAGLLGGARWAPQLNKQRAARGAPRSKPRHLEASRYPPWTRSRKLPLSSSQLLRRNAAILVNLLRALVGAANFSLRDATAPRFGSTGDDTPGRPTQRRGAVSTPMRSPSISKTCSDSPP